MAEIIRDSVSSDVSLLTKYDMETLAELISNSKSLEIDLAEESSILIENVEESINDDIITKIIRL
ncbi:hypothetical protein MARBORIA2_09020 [Methanobrevibacter arboriphilus]|uniref:Uncharacterized protein n=1 Tax=Methanobrevibacter arboriphilus TaxID=39441 RepID=A0ACA8R3S7_METAZ|nr:hypothetical protein MarbSA_11950 [Methanobrevibacter arboriphilus]GLI11812.1 hypothetical protein MARBORIA2_09020 [Methanobrevibacter arboriphilus]